MQTIEKPVHRIEEAERPVWFGQMPAGWGDTLQAIEPGERHDAAAMIDSAGLGWTVEQCPLEAVLAIGEDGHASCNSLTPGF
jgi:hypothetical protein